MENSVTNIAAQLNSRIGDVAAALLGDPNIGMTSKSQLRFGAKGSIAVEIAGEKAGVWYDHECGIGGDGLDLVAHALAVDKGAAIQWGRQWLGGSAAPISHDASREPKASETQDPGRAERLAAHVAACEDPQGTCVDTYLHSRGITARPLPPSIRIRRNAYGGYSALVALATDDAGEVHGLQFLYLTEDGKKAPVEIQRRTNKAHDGWAEISTVRMPGAAPIVLCEGVETALSIWQATGLETWACLGVTNIGKAPVPKGTAVIVARDGDLPGSRAESRQSKNVEELKSRGFEVTVVSPPLGMDFNNVLLAHGEHEIRRLLIGAATNASTAALPSWRDQLLRSKGGAIFGLLANAIHALRSAPEWDGVLWYNDFSSAIFARKRPPWDRSPDDWSDAQWTDQDDCLATEWLQRQGIKISKNNAGLAIETVASFRRYDPVREYLDSLVWDGKPRLDDWLVRYLGVDDSPYVNAVGPCWLISAAARVYQPGSKVDCVLVLEGPQGIGKSSALAALGDPWFSDRLSDLRSKDAAMETRGSWIIEIAELDSMRRAQISTIKAFLSRSHDRFRLPYGKRLVDLPRHCVFAGSINPDGGYLKDATGGRRFWPVRCGVIDLEALKRDRDQLWAEARDRFHSGQAWWLDTAALEQLAADEQADRYQGDEWQDAIAGYVLSKTKDDVSLGEVLQEALGIPRADWSQSYQNRAARCLVSLGFKRYRARIGGHATNRPWRYRRS